MTERTEQEDRAAGIAMSSVSIKLKDKEGLKIVLEGLGLKDDNDKNANR